MISPLQKYKISLFGEIQTLVSDEPQENILSAVHQVDTLMKEIAAQTRCSDAKRVALLAALRLAQQLQDQSKLIHLINDELKDVIA